MNPLAHLIPGSITAALSVRINLVWAVSVGASPPDKRGSPWCPWGSLYTANGSAPEEPSVTQPSSGGGGD